MNLVRAAVKNAAIGVGIADDPASLNTFLQPGCAATIWRRQPPQHVVSWLNALDPQTLPQGRVVLPLAAVKGALHGLCDECGLPNGSERDWLEADIASLAAMFAELMKVEHLRLRLAVVKTNACRKFHLDAVTARLICTYRGTGTQYGISTDGDDPKRVFTVPTGAPILLRGSQWPEQPPSGLLHRSPPIEGTDETRLVLVLDPIFDPEREA